MAAKESNGFHFDQRHRRYRIYFMMRQRGTRIRRTKLLPRGMSEEDAKAIAASMRASATREMAGLEPANSWITSLQAIRAVPGSWFHEMLWRAKQRSRVKGCAFTLTPDDLMELLTRSNGQCEVTGVTFSDRGNGRGKMRPLIPSLDRITPASGYTKDNCRIVCAAINVAMFTWGEELFKSLAIGYLINKIIAPHAPIFRGVGPRF